MTKCDQGTDECTSATYDQMMPGRERAYTVILLPLDHICDRMIAHD